MIRIKPLPNIALTDLQPAFYDVESATAVQMVSKFYTYLQNIVDDYNSFANEVNQEIENFENDTNANYEEFQNCIKNMMLDYIESIDTKINNQDLIIQDAVDYMKTNIVETTTSIVNDAIDDGLINVSVTYDPEDEEISIITSEGSDNNG